MELGIDALNEKALWVDLAKPALDTFNQVTIPAARDAGIAIVDRLTQAVDHAAETFGNVLHGEVITIQDVGTKWLTDAAKLLDGWTLTLSRPTK